MATPQELRLAYPESWVAPDRYVQLWRGNNQTGKTQQFRSNDILCPDDDPRCRNCFTIRKGGVGPSEANSVKTVGVAVRLFNKDNCQGRSELIPINTTMNKLSDIGFANKANSVELEWNEDDKLPCCFGVKSYTDNRVCNFNWLAANITDPNDPHCYNAIKQAVAQNPNYLQYQNFRDWCRATGDCDDAMQDYCDNNPNDEICGCLSSSLKGGLAVCADERCANRAAYRTKEMRGIQCPDIVDCRQIITQIGNVNTMEDLVQQQTCMMYKEQGLLPEDPTTPGTPGVPTMPTTPSTPTPGIPTTPSTPTPGIPSTPTVPIFVETESSSRHYWMWLLLLFIVVVALGLFYFRGGKTESALETASTVQPIAQPE